MTVDEGRGGTEEAAAQNVVVRIKPDLGSEGTCWSSVKTGWMNDDERLGLNSVVMKAKDD